jgi:hypothetical protein
MKKSELLAALEDTHAKLTAAVEGLPEEAILEPGVIGNWSVKDILAHLSRWEAEAVKLMWQARQGLNPSTILNSPDPVDEVNERWWREDQKRPLDRILADYHGVRQQTIRRLDFFTDEDLNNPARYPWLEGDPLWKWIASESYQHEEQHLGALITWREQKTGSGAG